MSTFSGEHHAHVYHNRGLAYSKLGNYQQAIEDYSKAIKLTPELAEAYLARGFAYFKLGNDEQSINDAKIAASLGHKKAQNALKKQGIKW